MELGGYSVNRQWNHDATIQKVENYHCARVENTCYYTDGAVKRESFCKTCCELGSAEIGGVMLT